MLFSKSVEELTANDIQSLINEGVSESIELDYKRDLPTDPAGWDELYADVCAFANTLGGYIIYGVDEQGGRPVSIVGVQTNNPDELKQRLNQRILRNIRPRPVPVPRITAIDMTNGRYVLVIYVPRSWQSPHAVSSSGEWSPIKAFARNSSGKYMLDISQLRTMLLFAESLADRVRQFRYDRVAKLLSGETPVRLTPGPRPIVHYLPASAFIPGTAYELEALTNCQPFIRAVAGFACRYNVDGLLYYSDPLDQRGCYYGYVQVFRNGVIEHVMSGYNVEEDGTKLVACLNLKDDILKYGELFLQTLRFLNIDPPVWVAISLVGYKDYFLDYNRWAPTHPTIDRDPVLIEAVQIDDLNQDASTVLRALLDLLWQAGGFQRCPY